MPTGLRALIATQPELAGGQMEHWCDHSKGTDPLNYIAMLRFDANRLGLPRDLPGTGAVARALLEAGAPVEGPPGDAGTPLMTAASYGDAEVARVLIEAGVEIEAEAADDNGGVPRGTALLHAAVFGMTEVLDLLVAADARIHSIQEAAAAGDLTGWLGDDTDPEARIRALVMAADHQRLTVIDQLIAAGTPIDAVDSTWGRQTLCVAAENGRVVSVKHLLALGANPNARDGKGRTPLECCRSGGTPDHNQVCSMLRALTS